VPEQPDGRPRRRRQRRQRPCDEQAPALRALHREPLRGELADHERDEGQHDGHEHDAAGTGAAPRAGREDLHERLGERDGRRGRGEEPGEGDPDLDRREEPVGVAGEPGEGTRPAPPRSARRASWLSRRLMSASSLPANAALVSTSTPTSSSCHQMVSISAGPGWVGGRWGAVCEVHGAYRSPRCEWGASCRILAVPRGNRHRRPLVTHAWRRQAPARRQARASTR
jgi:hypothetical protein